MKVAVYAIAKNEGKFAERWMASMGEADTVTVLDTGSTDDTVSKLRSLGAEVTEEIVCPWRFDNARNRSLSLLPEETDICVCTDLDEVFHPGWRKRLEEAWTPGTTSARYRYTWSFTPEGREGVVYYMEKIHSRRGWRWAHPVHEVLQWSDENAQGSCVTVEGMQLDHHPDPQKPRAQYLPLLELAVAECPGDDRNMHYLGREYMFYRRWDDCIRTLRRHLAMPTAVWRDERCASMRFIARSYAGKGEYDTARDWYLRAIAEAPWLREPYIDLAFLLYSREEWEGVLFFTGCALRITERGQSYICEAESWGALPYDLRSIAFSRTGRLREAIAAAEAALEREPGNGRIRDNLALFRKYSD